MGEGRRAVDHSDGMETLGTRDSTDEPDLTGISLPGDQPPQAARILVVEDEEQQLTLMSRVLERHGHVAVAARTGSEALRLLYSERPDLVLLDLGLPDVDGRITLERMREVTDAPIMVVTARDTQEDTVDALRAGADDYVTKPFGIQEVLARIDALLRRVQPDAEPARRYADPVLEIDYASLDVRIAGEPVELTALQLRVLVALVEHAGKVLSAQQILSLAWGDDMAPRERVKLYVGYLREKFRERGVEPPIETVRGFGYRYRRPA
jgi:DNA-binding response OmpR family regulator